MKPYGVLLVTGSHTHQENYAAAFAADRRCRLVALSDQPDVDPERRELNQRLARAHGIPYIADLGEALQREDIQIVSICAPPERRGRIIIQCAQAGKHLYLDKSLTPQLAEADAIVAAVQAAGVKSHMFTMIPQSWVQEARRVVQAGELGRLRAIHCDCFFAKGRLAGNRPAGPRREEYPPRRHQLPHAKRELDNVGVYPITQVRWLTGLKFRTVFGVTGNYFFQEHRRLDVEDFGVLSAALEDGTPVTIAAGRYGWTSHPASGVNRMVLVGDKQTMTADANRPRLEVYVQEPPWTPPSVHPTDPMGFWQSTQDESHVQPKKTWSAVHSASPTDAAYFLDCLDAGRDSDIPVQEAAHATEVLLAAYRSAATGEAVRLPLLRPA